MLLFSLLLSLAACSSKDDENASQKTKQENTAERTKETKSENKQHAEKANPKDGNIEKNASYNGVFASDPKLTPLDIIQRDPKTLPFLRNEVFARHGRAFKTAKYAEYFAKKPWYKINPNYNEKMLTQNDAANVALIRSFEGSAGAQKALKGGEYFNEQSGDEGERLVFFNAKTLEVVKGFDIYFSDAKRYSWTALGEEWIVTWTGADSWNAKNSSATLWKLNHKKNVVTEKYPVKKAM